MKLTINGKSVEVSIDDLTKALEEKKETFDIKSELTLMTVDEHSTFKDNVKKEGIAIGAEVGRKEVLKGFGIEGEGFHKTDTKTIEAITKYSGGLVSKALEDAKIEPNKQLEAKDADIAKLQNNISEIQGNFDTFKSGVESDNKSRSIKATLSGLIPDNTINSKADMLTLMSGSIKADIDENGIVFGIGADGQPIKDQTTMALKPIKDVVIGYFDENPHYLKTSGGGAAGGDSSGGNGKQTLEAFTKEMQDAGHNPNGAEFNKILGERMTANTIDLD